MKRKQTKHISSVCRQTAYARNKRDKLIELMGGKCVLCGSEAELEFDHPDGREYEARKLSYAQRCERGRWGSARRSINRRM